MSRSSDSGEPVLAVGATGVMGSDWHGMVEHMDEMTFRLCVIGDLRRLQQVQEEICGSGGKPTSIPQLDEVYDIRSKLEAATSAKVALANELTTVRQEHQHQIAELEAAYKKMLDRHQESSQRTNEQLQEAQQVRKQEFDKQQQGFEKLQRHLDQCCHSLRSSHRFPPLRLTDNVKMLASLGVTSMICSLFNYFRLARHFPVGPPVLATVLQSRLSQMTMGWVARIVGMPWNPGEEFGWIVLIGLALFLGTHLFNHLGATYDRSGFQEYLEAKRVLNAVCEHQDFKHHECEAAKVENQRLHDQNAQLEIEAAMRAQELEDARLKCTMAEAQLDPVLCQATHTDLVLRIGKLTAENEALRSQIDSERHMQRSITQLETASSNAHRQTNDKVNGLAHATAQGFRSTHQNIDHLAHVTAHGFRQTDRKIGRLAEATAEGFQYTDAKIGRLADATAEGFRNTDARIGRLADATAEGFKHTDDRIGRLADATAEGFRCGRQHMQQLANGVAAGFRETDAKIGRLADATAAGLAHPARAALPSTQEVHHHSTQVLHQNSFNLKLSYQSESRVDQSLHQRMEVTNNDNRKITNYPLSSLTFAPSVVSVPGASASASLLSMDSAFSAGGVGDVSMGDVMIGGSKIMNGEAMPVVDASIDNKDGIEMGLKRLMPVPA